MTEGTRATVVGEDRDGDPAGPGVHVIRPSAAHLDSWFLAGFLLSPGTLARATGNRVDVRQLEAPLLPLADQERYARVFRDARSLETITAHLKNGGGSLAGTLTAGLTSGDFSCQILRIKKPRPATGDCRQALGGLISEYHRWPSEHEMPGQPHK